MKKTFSRSVRRFISLLLIAAIILAIAPSVVATVEYQGLERLVNPKIRSLANGETIAQIQFFDSLGDNWSNCLKPTFRRFTEEKIINFKSHAVHGLWEFSSNELIAAC